MPGLVPGIHVLAAKTWMAGTSPAMTKIFSIGILRSALCVHQHPPEGTVLDQEADGVGSPGQREDLADRGL